jgi:allantoinase
MKEQQSGDFMNAWGGISSLQLRLPIMWTRACERNIGLSTLAQWLCSAPAALVGLEGRKGRIAAGYNADIVIWDPEETFEVSADRLYHRHKVTPYKGSNLRGVVKQTYLRGESVFNGGEFSGPSGGLILS